MADLSILRIRGVHTHANRMSEVPEGAVARATNMVIDRESLAGPRRGLPRNGGNIVSPAAEIRRLIPYDGEVLAHYGTTLKHDGGTRTWSAYSTAISEPASGFRVRDEIANGSLFLTSSIGIRKIDDVTDDHVAAGVHQPLDGRGSLDGSSGFLGDDNAVGYRAVIYETDEQDREIVSAPSQRLVVQNALGSAATRNVALTWYLPTGLTTDHYWRIYRSAQTDAATDPPSDELQLVAEGRLTSTDITNGYVTTTDATPDDLRGETLYTSPSQEGIAQANEMPPMAMDLAMYENHMAYANVRGKHRFLVSLLGVGSTALRFVTDNGDTTNGSAVVSSLSDTSDMRAGMRWSMVGFTGDARIQSVDSANQVTIDENATVTDTGVDCEAQDVVRIAGVEYFAASATSAADREFKVTTSGTASQNIEDTALELVFVVNQDPSSTLVYGFYDSGFEDVPGLMRFQERGVGGSSFQLSTTAPEAFSPTLPTTDNSSQVSSADLRENEVAISKQDRPESVPLGSRVRCGEGPIKRILALRDAWYVFSDEIGRISGTGRDNFSYDTLDRTAKIVGPETAVVVNDAVYCQSTQGVIRVTQAGVQVISRAIETDLRRSMSFTGYQDLAHAVGYETDRCYILWQPEEDDADAPTMCWRYNAFTNAWTDWDVRATAACVDDATDRLLTADDEETQVRRERKSHDRTDHADEELAVTISSSSGAVVTLADATGVAEDDLLVQDVFEARVVSVDGNDVTVDDTLSWDAAAATVYTPILCTIEPVPWIGGDPFVMKQFSEVGFAFRDAEFEEYTVAFANDFFPNFDYTVVLEPADTGGSFGTPPWGNHPWGSAIRDEQVVRTYVPREIQRAHWLRMSLQFNLCRETMLLAGFGAQARPLSRRFQGAGQS